MNENMTETNLVGPGDKVRFKNHIYVVIGQDDLGYESVEPAVIIRDTAQAWPVNRAASGTVCRRVYAQKLRTLDGRPVSGFAEKPALDVEAAVSLLCEANKLAIGDTFAAIARRILTETIDR